MRSLRARLRRLNALVGADDGMSLLEAVIALVIASSVFLAMAAAGMTAVRASLVSRATQQVGDFMTQKIEQVRALGYDAVANRTGDLSGDSNLTTCASASGFCLAAVSGQPAEPVQATASGSIYPHVQDVTSTSANNLKITLSTYVTSPTDAYGASYKRVTVIAKYSVYGVTTVKRESTTVTRTLRGLPLPIFRYQAQGSTSLSINPGARASYYLWVSNLGARDRFNLTESDTWDWTYYLDSNNNGVYDTATDTTQLSDSNGDGIVDTGFMEPNTTLKFFAVYRTDTSQPTGVHATTFSATSVAQPTASFATQTVAVSTNVVNGVITSTPTATSTPTPTVTTTPPTTDCPAPTPTATASKPNSSYSLMQYSLHNDNASISPGVSTTAQTTLDMNGTAPFASSLSDYATDVSTDYGRVVRPSTAGWPVSATTADSVVDWRIQYPASTRVGGTATLTLWARPEAGSGGTSVSLTAYLYRLSGSTYSQLSSVTLTSSPVTCGGWQQYVGSLSLSTTTLSANDYVGVKLINTGTTNTAVAYDVATTYPSALVLAVK